MTILIYFYVFLVGVVVGFTIASFYARRTLRWGIKLIQEEYRRDPNREYPATSQKYVYAIHHLRNLIWFI